MLELMASDAASFDACYAAMKARDARFDGCFFTGVTSTGIYCRPVCSVKAPKRENCRFFGLAAQAESAGFRPCLRCRPELAPHSVVWSIQDASYILAHQAARLLDAPESWAESAPTVEKLALKLGISARHLRRIFETQFGVSPLQYLQTRRLHTAKHLLADTLLPITQVALMSGFVSLRRFNAAFMGHYKLNPTQLRRAVPQAQAQGSGQGITVQLAYRPPYDVTAMLAFMSKRSIATIESIADSPIEHCARRTFGIETDGKRHTGWLQMRFEEARSQLVLRVSDSLRDVLPVVIRRVRAAFDLDADPQAINAVLHDAFPAARTLAQRLVETLGEPITTPWPALCRLFPSAAVLAQASGDTLGQLGIARQRQVTIVSLARAVAGGGLQLDGGADVQSTVEALKALPGIGDWTAQYIAMRALRWPDAFPAGDVALHKALGVQGMPAPARLAEDASLAWKPWRSYAVVRVWSGAWLNTG